MSENTPHIKPKKKRPVLRMIGRILGVVVLLVVILWVYVMTDAGTERVVRYATTNLLPLDAAEIEYESVRGNPFSHLTLSGVSLTKDSDTLIEADSLHIRYDVLSLPSQSIKIGSVRLVRPVIRTRQNASGQWDLQNVFISNPDAVPPDIWIGKLQVNDGKVFAIPNVAPAGTQIAAEKLDVDARDLYAGSRFALRTDSISAEVASWSTPAPVNMFFSGRLDESLVAVDSLSIQSERSDLTATGVVDAASILSVTDEVTEIHVLASPLHFGDITSIVPSVDPTISIDGRVSIVAKTAATEIDGQATFSDESEVRLVGEISRLNADKPMYSFESVLSGPRLSWFDASLPADRIFASASGQLAGDSADSLTGDVKIESTSNLTYKGFTLLPSVIAAGFESGEATVVGSFDLAQGSIKLDGTTRPFDEAATYDLLARIVDLNVSSVVPSLPDPLSGQISIMGTGTTAETIDARIDFGIDQLEINRLNVIDLSVESAVRQGRANVRASIRTANGALTSSISGSFIDRLDVLIEDIAASNFDLAAAAGDTTASAITGNGAASFVFEAGSFKQLSGNFVADSLVYGELAFDGMTLEAQSVARMLTGSAVAGFNGSTIQASVRAREMENGYSLQSASSEFNNLDLSYFYTGLDSTSLTGQIDIGMADGGRDARDWSLRLDSSRVNNILVHLMEMDGLYRADSTTFALLMSSSAGDISGEGIVQLDGTSPTLLEIETGQFAALDPFVFISSQSGLTSLNGTLSSTVDLVDAAGNATARIEFAASQINGIAIDGALLQSEISNNRGPIEGTVSFGAGSLLLDSNIDLSGERPQYRVDLNLVDAPIGQLVFADTLSSSVTANIIFEGSGSSLRDADLELSLFGQDSHYGASRLFNLDAVGSLRNGVLLFERAELESNVLRASASGSLGLWSESSASDFELTATVLDARPLNAFLKRDFDIVGNGILYATVEGRRGSESFSVDTDLQSLVYGDFRAGGLTSAVSGNIAQPLVLESLTSYSTIENFSTPSLTVRRTDFDIGLEDDTLRFDIFSTIDKRRNGSFNGLMDTGDEERIFLIEDISLTFDDDDWELLQPTTVAYQDFYEIRNLLIFTDDQQIALDGVIDLDGDQSLLLTVEEFRMGAVADLLGFSGLDGTVNGYLDLTGPAESPIMSGDLLSTVESFGKSYGDLNLVLAYDSLKLNLNGVLTNEDGSTFTVDGHIPVNLQLASSEGQTESGIRVAAGQAQSTTTVDLNIESDGFSLDWILPFLDPEVYSDIGGTMTGAVEVTGTVSDPVLDGEATLSAGHVGLVYFGLVYKGISGDLGFDGQTINLEHVAVKSGSGELIAVGTVSLSQLNLGKFDIALSAENFLAVDNDDYKGSVIADLNMSGTTNDPYISGYANVVSGEMFLNGEYEEFESVSLTQDDLLEVERVFGIRVSESDTSTFDFYEALALDINLTLERNMWLRSDASPEMDIQFTGDLDMRKAKKEDMQIFGNIEVIPDRSRITELGKRFTIVSGSLTFTGPATDPELNIEAHHTIRSSRTGSEDITIILTVKGQLDDLEEAPLDSDPEMELADILSYLAFGRPARETLQFTGAGGENLAKDIALGQATGYLEGLAGSELGFDVFEIEQQDFETRLTAGKYITQRLFVSVSQPISFSGQASELTDENIREITAEFELIQNLLLKLTQRENLKFDVLWQYAY
ncbi:MAG: hypothetical protein HKN43_06610 [Rhodothermales bacterium]|nr:hypothetical protein [Rhodothermales bacterium]